MATIRLVRHATVLVTLADTTLLVDPMLDPAGARDPIPNTPNDRRNPLVDLPAVDLDPDALLVTHLHEDHLDATAVERFQGERTFCQPADEAAVADRGLDPRPVEEMAAVDGVRVTRTPARHGHGDLADAMAPVSGFVLDAPGEPTVYLTGDTVWYDEVAATLATHDPDVVVCNAGGARFVEGEQITMTAEDIREVCAHTDAAVVAVHMEAINHCLLTREALRGTMADAGATVHVPDDGEALSFEG